MPLLAARMAAARLVDAVKHLPVPPLALAGIHGRTGCASWLGVHTSTSPVPKIAFIDGVGRIGCAARANVGHGVMCSRTNGQGAEDRSSCLLYLNKLAKVNSIKFNKPHSVNIVIARF